MIKSEKKAHQIEKSTLHQRNKHRERYNFVELIESCPQLSSFVKLNNYNDESIDFFDPEAVKMLNKALLMRYYNIQHWDIPKNYLCPPIPGRADYIHNIADLLSSSNNAQIPTGSKIKCLDIGVGANCIYPIIGQSEYGWSFIGSDIDKVALESAGKIVELNSHLKNLISLRLQNNSNDFFYGIIKKDELFDVTICNPPFHSSAQEAQESSIRKLSNLKRKNISKPILNFGGQSSELWCDGGEERFVTEMIIQSKMYSECCFWFSSLVSKESNLNYVYDALHYVDAYEVEVIALNTTNKTGRIVAWTFLDKREQQNWVESRWSK